MSFHVNPSVNECKQNWGQNKNGDKNSGGEKVRPAKVNLSIIFTDLIVDFSVVQVMIVDEKVGEISGDKIWLDDCWKTCASKRFDGADGKRQSPSYRDQDPRFEAENGKLEVSTIKSFRLSNFTSSKLAKNISS